MSEIIISLKIKEEHIIKVLSGNLPGTLKHTFVKKIQSRTFNQNPEDNA